MSDEKSIITILSNNEESKSEFDRAFSQDTLWRIQTRMHAKSKFKHMSHDERMAYAKSRLIDELSETDASSESMDEIILKLVEEKIPEPPKSQDKRLPGKPANFDLSAW